MRRKVIDFFLGEPQVQRRGKGPMPAVALLVTNIQHSPVLPPGSWGIGFPPWILPEVLDAQWVPGEVLQQGVSEIR